MEYNFRDIEKKWQDWWTSNQVYKVLNPERNDQESRQPKCYVLDMFPYPSGAGLHVGHPLGYIASDIYSRYKRLKGFNVLHPMGYDAFGLPAEQYAIEHGIHPAVSTATNIRNFRKQLDKLGFSFDWDREVNTSEPSFYKWTQWIFLQLFESFYNRKLHKAEPIAKLIEAFEQEGNLRFEIPSSKFQIPGSGSPSQQQPFQFTANEWNGFDAFTRESILMEYRLSYCSYGEVNWCEALGTVLANDEVINGVSERGGYPVVKKKLRQWYLRITEYADRLLEGLERVAFSDAMKEMQSNWIGKSSGAEIDFAVRIPSSNEEGLKLRVYTTRPDTIFGVDFMVIAPEHELLEKIITPAQKDTVDEYIAYVKSRNERERMAEKKISGAWTGSFALNPFDNREIPIWIAEYVLAGYGTGAIMAVPCGDERDHRFANHFGIPITNIIGKEYNGTEANPTKDAILENSDFLNGIVMKEAIEVVIRKIEERGIGVRKVNYKIRDAAFSRQRYWGEPFPIIWKDGIAFPLSENELPLELPHVENYKPGPDGEGPLANIKEWIHLSPPGRVRETNTMPGYAGSSWYFLRYMDPHNDQAFCDRNISDYWGQVDIYIGGTEHAVGHLLYSRMWTKCLYDLGYINFDEPYKKLVNQGMIQGSSRFIYRLLPTYLNHSDADTARNDKELTPVFIPKLQYDQVQAGNIDPADLLISLSKSHGINKSFIHNREIDKVGALVHALHADVNIVNGFELDIHAFRQWRNGEYANAVFVLDDGSVNTPHDNEERKGSAKYTCGAETEKMSKSKFNTVNPDDLVLKYGADTFRMYEMFLGPVEMSKPWDTKGIEGVHRFLKKFWRLFFDDEKSQENGREGLIVIDESATHEELKVLHKAIKKIEEDTERFSFNTAVSAFMIATNELSDLKCHKKEILESMLILLAPYAPHITEELYDQLNKNFSLNKDQKADRLSGSILGAIYPRLEEKYLVESSKEYPISINGKLRTTMNISLEAIQSEIEKIVLENEVVRKWLEGKQPKKIIYVKNKMINVVV